MATDDARQAGRPGTEHDGAALPARSAWVLLASRISRWTTRGILTGIILVAGLVFGRQVLTWWGHDQPEGRPPSAATPGNDLGDESIEHVLRFGDNPWSMHRQAVSGDLPTAIATLVARCRAATIQGALPEAQPSPQEQEFLKSLAQQEPVAREPGKWRVFRFDEAIPMVVGTREVGGKKFPAAGGNVAGIDLRVVTWGFGVPAAPDSWTLYTFVQAPPDGGKTPDGTSIPLPPGCIRTMSVGVRGGGTIVTFRGPLEPETWKLFFDHHFRQRDWTSPHGWRQTGDRWSNRYAGAAARDGAATGAVELEFGPDERGGLTGLAMVSYSAAEP